MRPAGKRVVVSHLVQAHEVSQRRACRLGASHSATKAFAKAATTMAKVDLWHARLALKTLRRDQREAIAEAAED